MADDKIIPSRTVLLLLDFQVIYASMNPGMKAVMVQAGSVAKAAREKGITVAHCRVAFTEAEMLTVPDTNKTFSQVKHNPARAAVFEVNAPEAAFYPAVAPQDGDIVLRKHRVGPFFNAPQDTHAIFKERGFDTLLIGGVSTGGAVAATVVQGSDLDYRIIVLEDACADPNQETHDFFIKFFAKRGAVIKSEELETLTK